MLFVQFLLVLGGLVGGAELLADLVRDPDVAHWEVAADRLSL